MPVTAVTQTEPNLERGYFSHEQMSLFKPVHYFILQRNAKDKKVTAATPPEATKQEQPPVPAAPVSQTPPTPPAEPPAPSVKAHTPPPPVPRAARRKTPPPPGHTQPRPTKQPRKKP